MVVCVGGGGVRSTRRNTCLMISNFPSNSKLLFAGFSLVCTYPRHELLYSSDSQEGGNTILPPKHLAMSEDILGCHSWGWNALGHLVGRSQGCCSRTPCDEQAAQQRRWSRAALSKLELRSPAVEWQAWKTKWFVIFRKLRSPLPKIFTTFHFPRQTAHRLQHLGGKQNPTGLIHSSLSSSPLSLSLIPASWMINAGTQDE